jgi:NRPS condensation-like uncharacterized protein
MRTFPAAVLDGYIALQDGYNDHRIRAVMAMSGAVDDGRLQEALRRSLAAAPVLAYGYEPLGKCGRWVQAGHAIGADRFYCAQEASSDDDLAAAMESALAAPIDQAAGPQFHITRIRYGKRDSLCAVMNHVAMDGSGFKAWLALVARLYSGTEGEMPGISEREALRLLEGDAATRDPTGTGAGRLASLPLPSLADAEREARLFIWRGKLADLTALRGQAVDQSGAIPTINDCLMALVLAACESAGIEAGRLSFMIDARRYCVPGTLSPFSNASSMESIGVPETGLPLAELARKIGARTRELKGRAPGLASLRKLRAAASLLPPPVFRYMLRRAMRSASLSTTNLGAVDEGALVFGQLRVEDLYFVTALKEEPSLQFSFSSFGGRMAITSYGRYSPTNAERIAAVYSRFGPLLETALQPAPSTSSRLR